MKISPRVARLVLILALFAAWEIGARFFADPMYVAAPSKVLAGLPALFQTPGVPDALLVTLAELCAAFALSVVIGLSLGLAVGLNTATMRTAMPIILLLYATPQAVILPLFVLYFGIGPGLKIAFGVSHGMFPVLVTVVANVQNIKPALLRAARSMGASRWQTFRHVIFPHMIPGFFTGLRLGMTAVLLGVLLAELYVSQNGIGAFARQFGNAESPTNLFGLVAVIATIAIVLNEIVRRAEIRFSRWRN